MLPVDWVFLTSSAVDRRYVGRKAACITEYERSPRGKGMLECTAVHTINTEHQSRVAGVVF